MAISSTVDRGLLRSSSPRLHTNVGHATNVSESRLTDIPPSTSGLYPKTMYINRGNHETRDMNRTYGFEGEAKHKHGDQTYKVPSIGFVVSLECRMLMILPALRTCIHSKCVACYFSGICEDSRIILSSAACNAHLRDTITSEPRKGHSLTRRTQTLLRRTRRIVQQG